MRSESFQTALPNSIGHLQDSQLLKYPGFAVLGLWYGGASWVLMFGSWVGLSPSQ
jgi:hypothetical protein